LIYDFRFTIGDGDKRIICLITVMLSEASRTLDKPIGYFKNKDQNHPIVCRDYKS
jgi:hypothetical protein